MEFQKMRFQLIMAILDALEALTGEEMLCIVTRADDSSVTPWVLMPNVELIDDKLNGWVDNTPWNSPKSL